MKKPLGFDHALKIISETTSPLPDRAYPLLEARGLVLSESLEAVSDMPSFDKSAVDGFAVRRTDVIKGHCLDVIEDVFAGDVASRQVASGEAVRIMTGAPVPAGADTVVMVETVRERPSETNRPQIEFMEEAPPGSNICHRGEDIAVGDELLSAKTCVKPEHIGILAGQGYVTLVCHRRPQVAALATGSELVPANQTPGEGQIRNSNSIALMSAVENLGAIGHDLGIALDQEATLREAIRRALTQDVVILSGGVSAGQRDLVPWALQEEGVEILFHHVAIKPGRPVLYGVRDATHVFGLPGNPVAAFVCFWMLVRPLLFQLMGRDPFESRPISAVWKGPNMTAFPLRRFIGVGWNETSNGAEVTPVPTRGSADLNSLARSEAFAVIAEDRVISPGSSVEVVRLQEY